MNLKIYFILFCLTMLTMASCNNTSGDIKRKDQKFVPIYVTPYFNSDPLTINVGKYSNQLLSNNPSKMLELSKEIKNNIDDVNVETIYTLSTRLYDLNQKDEAAYWFYTAQLRKNVVISMLDSIPKKIGDSSFELASALGAYHKLLGEYLNGYSFGNLDRLVEILNQVKADNQNMKYVGNIYPNINFKSDAYQKQNLKQAIDRIDSMIVYINKNRDYIMQQRKANGIEGKY